jgi:hypothetical protein
MRYFVSTIKSHLIDNKILDPNIYRKGCFRLLWNSKAKKNINLELDKTKNYDYKNDKELFMDCILRNIPKDDMYLIKMDISKTLQLNKKNIKNSKIQNINDNKLINDYSYNYLKKYIDILDIKRTDNYGEWLQICICIYNCNSTKDGFKLFHEWSKNSEKYINEQDCINQWNIITQRKYNYGIGTLKYLAKLDNPEAYTKIELTSDLPQFESIKFNKSYLYEA